jgi:serine carboxypeptidase-like clade 1
MELTLKLLVLLLFILNHHVGSGSIVKFLPGFEGPLPFELETGYIGIGEEEEVQLFYYFIKSERNPKEDPLLLWLSGGPGCSSITGLLFQNGPLALKSEVYNGSVPSLVSTTYSWTKTANIIFLDQPVGAGFSYSRAPLIDTPTDTGEVKRIHEFLQKWLSKHPQFSSNHFYAGGDSYSGMIVPALVQEISKGNYICCNPPINLKGYVLGNPITHEDDPNYRIPFSHGMALISDELYESIREACKGNYFNVDPRNTKCLKLVEEFHKCTDKLNEFHILSPDCDTASPDCYLYPFYLISFWANDESVRDALHVNKRSIGKWERCNYLSKPYNKDIKSSVPYHMNNSVSGYRSLIYSGDHDLVVPFLATQAWIKSLNYSIIHEWRPWMIKDQIAGYTRTYSNKMTFATVKGSGHTAENKPQESFIMFRRWINGQPL